MRAEAVRDSALPGRFSFLGIAGPWSSNHPARSPLTQEGWMRARSRGSRVWFVLVAASVACSAASLMAQDTQDKLIFVPIRATQVMSAADQQRIGIDRLT